MTEQHTKKNRGSWLPAEMVKLFEKGTITATECMLLALIDSFVGKETGCYASNAYLGQRVRLEPKTVSKAVAKFKKLGLVRQIDFDGRRRSLETCWSRLLFESEPAYDSNRPPPFPTEKVSNTAYGDGMPFFDEFVDTPPEGIELELSEQLRFLLKKHRRISGPSSKKNWAKEMKLLIKFVEGDHQRIVKVLAWLKDHLMDQYTPKVYSVRTFRFKFIQLEDAMQRDDDSHVEVGDVAQTIASTCCLKSWPKGSGTDVASVVQLSMDQYMAFMQRFEHLRHKLINHSMTSKYATRETKAARAFVKHLHMMMPRPSHFIEMWMAAIHSKIDNWDAWNGNLRQYVFDPDSEMFKQIGQAWAERYCADARRWDTLMEMLHESTEA